MVAIRPPSSLSMMTVALLTVTTMLMRLGPSSSTVHAFRTAQATRRTTRFARRTCSSTQLHSATTTVALFSSSVPNSHSYSSSNSLVISDGGGVGEAINSSGDVILHTSASSAATDSIAATVAATATDASATFIDQIDYFGDPTIRTLFIVFGGVVLLLTAISALSRQVDAAIENVIVDFENVLKSSTAPPEFQSKWKAIELQLKEYDNEVDKAEKRKQKLFKIMEEMEQTEPELMKRVSSKMDALNNSNK